MQGYRDGNRIGVKAVFALGVADSADDVPRNVLVIHLGLRRDFAHDVHMTGFAGGFACTAGKRVFAKERIQNRVGNLVAYLIGMAFRDGFRGKEMMLKSHGMYPFR